MSGYELIYPRRDPLTGDLLGATTTLDGNVRPHVMRKLNAREVAWGPFERLAQAYGYRLQDRMAVFTKAPAIILEPVRPLLLNVYVEDRVGYFGSLWNALDDFKRLGMGLHAGNDPDLDEKGNLVLAARAIMRDINGGPERSPLCLDHLVSFHSGRGAQFRVTYGEVPK